MTWLRPRVGEYHPAALFHRALFAAAALCVGLYAQTGRADDVRLSWVRGPGAHACARQETIAERVTERLGRSPFRDEAERSVEAYLTRDASEWHASIFTRDKDGALTGSRDLTSAAQDCGPIEAAIVLALALTIDPVAAMQPTETRAHPSAPAAPPPVPVPTPVSVPVLLPPLPLPDPRPSVPVDAPSRVPPFGASFRVGAALGVLPKLGVVTSLAVDVEVSSRLRVTGEAAWLPEVHTSDARFAFGLNAFALGVCGSLVRSERVSFAACGAVAAGAIHAVVYALVPVDPGQHPWVAIEAGPLLHVKIVGPLRVELGAPLVLPLIRQPFLVTGMPDAVFQESVLGFRPFLGVGASFR